MLDESGELFCLVLSNCKLEIFILNGSSTFASATTVGVTVVVATIVVVVTVVALSSAAAIASSTIILRGHCIGMHIKWTDV